MNNLVFVHLLNDFSGSPKVLLNSIKALSAHCEHAKLYLGSSGDGFLSRCDIPITRYWYQRSGQRILTLFAYALSQLLLFCKLLFDRSIARDAVIYVNTLFPFAAALYGRLTGRTVIYHIHEISITPKPLKFSLITITRLTSSLNIYVSDAHIQALSIPGVPAKRIYNSLDADFLETSSATQYQPLREGQFNVLMIASLRDYKGVQEFCALADSLSNNHIIRFSLVVNDDEAAIDLFFSGKSIPSNLIVYPRTNDTTAFYAWTSLVLNLSRPDQCVETFGMTILEAMAFGIPVIVPPVGGPAELVQDGLQGFHVNSYNLDLLKKKVLLLCDDQDLCFRMSAACRERAGEFSPSAFTKEILAAIDSVRT